MILAITKNGIIGIDNKIPWYIKADLQRFRELTSNHIVIMGRKTFESLPNGPLKHRINIVITRDPALQPKSPDYENVYYTTINKIDEVIEKIQYQEATSKKVFIIGGAQVYNYFISKIQKIYLTLIDKDINGDTFLNTEFLTNGDSEFVIKNISEQQICPNSNLPYTFIYYERKN
jgi:dihydrofolate reductase